MASSGDPKVDEFRKRLASIASSGVVGLSIALGHKLRIFDALAKVGSEEKPATSQQVADEANLKERYVREWLGTMSSGGIIEVDKSGTLFWIAKERVPDLVTGTTHAMVTFCEFIPLFGNIFEKMLDVFRKDGPLGMTYETYDDFHRIMHRHTASLHSKHLVSHFIPLTGLQDKLAEGIQALDVGCGNGFHVSHLAEHYPNSRFTGVDICLSAIAGAMQTLTDTGKGLKNAAFIQSDARNLEKSWTNKFDWVTIFDACHDQERPDLAIREIHRVLKPGGVFSMVELDGAGNPYEDKKMRGDMAAYIYGVSTFHCLPVGYQSPGALGMGAAWGQPKAKQLLHDNGFDDVKVIPTPFFPLNILYLCTKEK